MLHRIIQENLEGLVDHGGLLFLREVLRTRGIAGSEHMLLVEHGARIFESLRPVAVVAVFGRLFV